MKTLYFDCAMGAAGDMLTAALLELFPEREAVLAELNAVGLPGVVFSAEPSTKCGVLGTHVTVRVHGHEEGDGHRGHVHRGMHEIEQLISELRVSERVKRDVRAVYGLIAEAESRVHGVPVTDIHFHEVGTLDALADVTAVCLLMERLAPERVLASAVHVGCGQVRCAHGILPVPAPATVELLRGVPVYGGECRGELCTPTGAALLKYYVNQFGEMPLISPTAIGYGMGKKDFPMANCVRAVLGEAAGETVLELRCNLDDMTAEDIAFAAERLMEGGALDVFTVPIGMKKSRPGTMLCVLCREAQREALLAILFRHTTTLGVRESEQRRVTLTRRTQTLETPLGTVRKKISEGCGVRREKYEYEDLAAAARAKNLSLAQVREALARSSAASADPSAAHESVFLKKDGE